jgi:hypothetical protein
MQVTLLVLFLVGVIFVAIGRASSYLVEGPTRLCCRCGLGVDKSYTAVGPDAYHNECWHAEVREAAQNGDPDYLEDRL